MKKRSFFSTIVAVAAVGVLLAGVVRPAALSQRKAKLIRMSRSRRLVQLLCSH